MNKLVNSVRGLTNTKEQAIKTSIITQLSNSVKEIQLFGVDENLSGDSMDMSEAESTLCSVIEAMFLHGLKDSLTHRFRRAITDVDVKPEPSFWAPLLVISHRQIIGQIQNLSQVNTEIGQCRAWIRFVINDCLLSSYIMIIRQNVKAVRTYYNTHALMRDVELLDVAQRLIEGLESFKTFALPCNSSLLNSWPLPTLLLAGIWAPTLRSCPISAGVDVAESLQTASSINSETCSLASAVSLNSHSSGLGQILALNEDEALKIILAKHSDTAVAEHVEDQKTLSDLSECESRSEVEQTAPEEFILGNSLSKKSGWSFDENQVSTNNESGVLEGSSSENTELSGNNPADHSFNALIESYNMLGGAYIKTPDLREMWQQFEQQNISSEIEAAVKEDVKLPIDKFEAVGNIGLTRSESVSLVAQISKIATEKGLDCQDFECLSCQQPQGVTSKLKVCAFTGSYFCDDCMSSEMLPIPARIIHNWDFKMYAVSQKAFNYVMEIKDHPTIDFKVSNPYIYTAVEEMAALQSLRSQLNFLRAYLYTCQEPIIEQLQKQMWPREYMYEHIHQYSITDLSQITDGTLAEHLQKVVKFAKQHVVGCWLCSQKGFICEICNKPNLLFPFDVDHIYRCDVCSAVYHNDCFKSSKPCPKCERRKKREDLPLLGATIE